MQNSAISTKSCACHAQHTIANVHSIEWEQSLYKATSHLGGGRVLLYGFACAISVFCPQSELAHV